jgi:hypothetical protein
MRIRGRILAAVLLLGTAAFAQTQERPELKAELVSDGLERLDLFEGETPVRLANGQTKRVTVVVREWTMDNQKAVARFPVNGVVVFHLLGGEVTTDIKGQRQTRSDGEMWSLSPGVSISLQTATDTATIRTVEFRGLER